MRLTVRGVATLLHGEWIAGRDCKYMPIEKAMEQLKKRRDDEAAGKPKPKGKAAAKAKKQEQ